MFVVDGVEGDISTLRVPVDTREAERAERAARVAARLCQTCERAGPVGESHPKRCAERRRDVAHARITPAAARAATSSSEYPAPRRTSAECCPTSGGALR